VWVPLINGFQYSFFKWDGISPDKLFVGLKNFTDLVKDKHFLGSLSYSLIYTGTNVVFINIFALFLANLIAAKSLKVGGMVRTLFFAPKVISLIVVAMIWLFIFSNAFANLAEVWNWEFLNIDWFGNRTMARVVMFIVTSWVTTGYLMVIYIAGINAIDDSLIEAAHIDGCRRFQLFFRIKLPLIMPAVVICVFWMTLFSLKTFDLPYVLTGGGPYNSTETLPMNVYATAYEYTKFGSGSAKGITLFFIILIITVVELAYLKKREVER
jgi:raffinose/stachyose/melibiose transport system permease protein